MFVPFVNNLIFTFQYQDLVIKMTADHEKKAGDAQEVDIYRDTPVRLLGYANEVGEAFRALVHVNWVRASYGVASLYVLVSLGLS